MYRQQFQRCLLIHSKSEDNALPAIRRFNSTNIRERLDVWRFSWCAQAASAPSGLSKTAVARYTALCGVCPFRLSKRTVRLPCRRCRLAVPLAATRCRCRGGTYHVVRIRLVDGRRNWGSRTVFLDRAFARRILATSNHPSREAGRIGTSLQRVKPDL